MRWGCDLFDRDDDDSTAQGLLTGRWSGHSRTTNRESGTRTGPPWRPRTLWTAGSALRPGDLQIYTEPSQHLRHTLPPALLRRGVSHKPRVLVVEDERTIAEAIAARLEAEGFAVDQVHDGLVALERAAAEPSSWWSWTSCCPVSTATRCAAASRQIGRSPC